MHVSRRYRCIFQYRVTVRLIIGTKALASVLAARAGFIITKAMYSFTLASVILNQVSLPVFLFTSWSCICETISSLTMETEIVRKLKKTKHTHTQQSQVVKQTQVYLRFILKHHSLHCKHQLGRNFNFPAFQHYRALFGHFRRSRVSRRFRKLSVSVTRNNNVSFSCLNSSKALYFSLAMMGRTNARKIHA